MWQFINIQKEVTSLSQTTEHNWSMPSKEPEYNIYLLQSKCKQ